MGRRVNDVAWLASELRDARAWSELSPLVIASIWEARTSVNSWDQRLQENIRWMDLIVCVDSGLSVPASHFQNGHKNPSLSPPHT